jgi:uncharacterized protein YjdB
MDAGDSGQQDLVNWFDEGTVRGYKIKYPNGVVDVFKGWVSSLGKTISSKEVMTRTVKITNNGKPSLAEDSGAAPIGVTGISLDKSTAAVAVAPRPNWWHLSCQQVLQINLSA